MERKVILLYVSLNPEYYDLKRIAQFTFDEALEFCKTDQMCAMAWGTKEINITEPQVFAFHADGVEYGDGTDTMFNWLKVE